MKIAIIESPYASTRDTELKRNIAYARLCVSWALQNGYAPFASHLLYTQPLVLDDDNPEERQAGIDAGLRIGEVCDVTLLFTDLGISRGMQYGIDAAKRAGRPILEISLIDVQFHNVHTAMDLIRTKGRTHTATRRGWA